MIFRLALRSLMVHPIRTLLLACGFGLGVGVMATLLGVGDVILEQARSPAIVGGGDVVVSSATGSIPAADWMLSGVLRSGRLGDRVAAASPTRRATIYLLRDGRSVPVRAHGGIPSLERRVGDPEAAGVTSWTDAPADTAWTDPDPATALRNLDRFHPVPDVPARADSWAEWLYFNGQSGSSRFYLTFLVGPPRADGRRTAGVRLQLDAGGERSAYSASTELDDRAVLAVLDDAPDLTVGATRVRLEGMRYRITIDLPVEPTGDVREGAAAGAARVRGELSVEATAGRALPPLTIRGAGGWLSGYVVPVMSGHLNGALSLEDAGSARAASAAPPRRISFDGGTGYHDHNWGFWKDVSWRWGQVQHGDLSLVYGRIQPPADAADAERIPGFLAVLSPDGPLGYAGRVSIQEIDDPAQDHPKRIEVVGRSASVNLSVEISPEAVVRTRTGGRLFGGGFDFLQMSARYRVHGTAGERALDFTAQGSAETFRRAPAP